MTGEMAAGLMMRLTFMMKLLFMVPLLALWSPSHARAELRCPRDISPVAFEPLEHSQIGIPVLINGRGPFNFMLDTGAQITIVDSELAAPLGLHPDGAIGIVSVANYAQANLASTEQIELGPYRVPNLNVALQSLDRIRMVNPKVQGILGEDFLAHFDLLIDNAHKALCLDETRQMQQAIRGERVAIVPQNTGRGMLSLGPPVLVTVHLPGDRQLGTIVRIDSGSSAPVLFSSRGEILPWLQRMHSSRGSVSGTGTGISLATMPAQTVHLTDHLERQITFLTPIGEGTRYTKAGEDGLLPTALFKQILISVRDRLVVFDPQDACPPEVPNQDFN